VEVSCGRGGVTRKSVIHLNTGGKVIADDLNADMLTVAKTKVNDERINWQVADAQQLHFSDNSFDHLVCQFGVMFFPDKPKAMAEAYRVLQPGGRYLFNVWDSLENNPRSAIIKDVMENIMGDEAPDFLRKGPYSWYDTNEISSLLKLTGFTEVNMKLVFKTAYYESPHDLITGFVKGSPLGGYLAEQTEELRSKITEALVHKVKSDFGEGRLESPMQAIICDCRK